MVPCHPDDIFSLVGELTGFTRDSAKPGVVWRGGDRYHGILCTIVTIFVLETELGISLLV
jgi:hypothetical protein